ncbi:GerAB/ArcD/ProY family transporter [Bacillus spongiae]|uniref:GerAB/ArcD/ProY family transporter n=1 Tax=Bacillus spongiae TaxID=2683610 RepID=A0ABU8HJP3_9BACI
MQEKLHSYQVLMLLYMIQIGVGIFSIPRLTAEAFGTNGWSGILIVSIILFINILLIGLVFHFGKGRTIFQLMNDVLPKFISRPLYVCLALLFSALAVIIARDFELLILMLYYPTMPKSVFILITLFISYWLVRGGIVHIGKFAVIFFSTILIAFLLGFHIPEFEFKRLSPFFFEGEKDLLRSGLRVAFAFLGYELSLLFVPYMAKNQSLIKPLVYAHLLLSFIYLVTCFIAFGFFSFNQLLNDMFPVITMLEYVEFPFMERTENFVTHLFIGEILITIVSFYWGADQFLRQAMPNISPRISIASLLLLSFGFSFFVQIARSVEEWLFILRSMELIVAILLPLLLLFLMWIIKLRHKDKVVKPGQG